jgi:flagellar biosynthesis protein FlhA
VRDLVRIFEGLSGARPHTKDPEALVEAARANLGAAISDAYAVDGRLPVLTFEPLAEHAMLEALRPGDGGHLPRPRPVVRRAARARRRRAGAAGRAARRAPGARLLARSCAPRSAAHPRAAPRLPVLSYAELGDQLQLDTIGVVTGAHAVAA